MSDDDVTNNDPVDELTERSNAFFRLPEKSLSASEFWRQLYAGSLKSLNREPGIRYKGEYDSYTAGQFLPRQQPFEILTTTIASYAFTDDPRFLLGPQASCGAAIAAVLRAPPMLQDTDKNQAQLDFARELLGEKTARELHYADEKSRLTNLLETGHVTLESLLERVNETTRLLLSKTKTQETLVTKQTLFIKCLSLCPPNEAIENALIDVVASPIEQSDIRSLAIWSLGRNGAHIAASYLTRCLEEPSLDHLGIEIQRALQFLGSGRDLLPIQYTRESFKYWRGINEAVRSRSRLDLHHARSVFWEQRLRASLWGPIRFVAKLANDEVPRVRSAAAARLSQKG